jgi:hypothetical protein
MLAWRSGSPVHAARVSLGEVRFYPPYGPRQNIAPCPKSANTDRDPPSDRNLAERQVIDSIADVATTFAQKG